METILPTNCDNCNKPFPVVGFYCGGCLTQFKCKSCGSPLEKDYAGCVNCGTPKEVRNNGTANTFHIHEKAGERTIDATFSDNAAKELADMMKETYALRLGVHQINNFAQLPVNNDSANSSADSSHVMQVLNPIKQEPQKDTMILPPEDYPSLLAIGMKNLPANDTEWVIVCAFYASNFGEVIFSRQSLIDKYKESNKFDDNKRKGLSAYITSAVKSNYINPLKDGYSILPKGVEKAEEIISRTSGATPKIKVISKGKKDEVEGDKRQNPKKSSAGSSGTKRLTDIDFYPNEKESLKDFYQKFDAKNDYENNLVFVYYFEEILKIVPISLNHLHTCYEELNLRIPENIRISVQNTKNRKGWIESQGKGNLAVTIKGKNKIKRWAEK